MKYALILSIAVLSLTAQLVQAFTTRICNNTQENISVKLNATAPKNQCPKEFDQAISVKANGSVDIPWGNIPTKGCALEIKTEAVEVNGTPVEYITSDSYGSNRPSETIFIWAERPRGKKIFQAALAGALISDCKTHLG